MKDIVRKLLASARVRPDMEFSLRQTERNRFAARVEHQKRHHFLAHGVFDLAGNFRALVADGAAAVNNNECRIGRRAFPDFTDGQFNFCENPPLAVALAGFVLHSAERNQIGPL